MPRNHGVLAWTPVLSEYVNVRVAQAIVRNFDLCMQALHRVFRTGSRLRGREADREIVPLVAAVLRTRSLAETMVSRSGEPVTYRYRQPATAMVRTRISRVCPCCPWLQSKVLLTGVPSLLSVCVAEGGSNASFERRV